MKKPAKKILIKENQSTNDIISGIIKGIDLSFKYAKESKDFFLLNTGSKILKNKFSYDNAKDIYNLCKATIKYKAERTEDQTIYTINRIIDGTLKTGDCKHNAIFNFSMLSALGIPNENIYIRFVSWKPAQSFRHVYIVLLDNAGNEIILDPVANAFDKELKYCKKIDIQIKK